MKAWKKTGWSVALAVVAIALVSRAFTFRWDASWAHSATLLTFDTPEQMLEAMGPPRDGTFRMAHVARGLAKQLSGEELHSYLRVFKPHNPGLFDLSCELDEQTGRITIEGIDYPFRLIRDKFAGNILEIRGRWKTVHLVSPG
ncbi:MAG: hypothetical protein K2R98_02480 [Gemmataceae bacterium]|nr:hypothetical protein [Gemmataceae bacterium]